MISQQRLDELKRCDNPSKFFDDFYCDVNIIVKGHRKVFEAKARGFWAKHLVYGAAANNLLEERKKTRFTNHKKTTTPFIFEQYRKQLFNSTASNPVPLERLNALEQCQTQLSDIFKQYREHGVGESNPAIILRESCIISQCQERLGDVPESVSIRESTVLEKCRKQLSGILDLYEKQGWRWINHGVSKQTRKGGYRSATHNFFVPPGFPIDPVLWLNVYDPIEYDQTYHYLTGGKATCSPEDELLRGYVALALLYNKQANKRGETMIAPDILSGTKAQMLLIEIPNRAFEGGNHWPDVRNVLISDLIAVDKNLAEQPLLENGTETKTIKNRPTSQGLTLLDEFEQNAKTLVGILEDGIKTIDKWFEDFKKVNEHNRLFFLKRTADDAISILESFYPFGDLFPEIKRFLTPHIPNFKDKVESGYSDINNKIEEIVGKCGYEPINPPANPKIPYAAMTELRRYIELLVGDLRHCVKEAKEDQAKGTGQPIKNTETQTDLNRHQTNTSGDNLQPDKVFLSRIAVEIEKQVIKAENLKTFCEKIRPFAKRWEKHNSDTENAIKKRNEHWQKVKSNPAWQDKKAETPQKGWEWDRFYLFDLGFDVGPTYEMPARYAPAVIAKLEDYIEANKQKLHNYNPSSGEYQRLENTIAEQEQNLADIHTQFDKLTDKNKGWISTAVPLNRPVQGTWIQFLWFRYTDLKDEEVFGCWRPPLKHIHPNPIDTLIPDKETEKLPPPINREQEYERYYVVLISIHDNMLTGVQSISDSIWPKELSEQIWFRFTEGQPYGPDKGFIEAALERVQADIVGEKQTGELIEISKSKPENYIKRGKVWTFHFAGQDVPIPDVYKGLPLLAYLLQNPNPKETISAFGLEQKVTARPTGKTQSKSEISDTWDNETESPELTTTKTGETANQNALAQASVQSLQDAIKELNTELETTINIERQEEINNQIKTLTAAIQKKNNRFGRPRPEAGNQDENARLRVIQKIGRIKKILLKDHKKLYDHLDLYLKIGTECSYTPENPPDWQVF